MDLKNEKHFKAIFQIYSAESFLYTELNKACRLRDHTKIKNLGPFAFTLNRAIKDAQKMNSKDTFTVYRGLQLPIKEVNKYLKKVGKIISLKGFTSTSLDSR